MTRAEIVAKIEADRKRREDELLLLLLLFTGRAQRDSAAFVRHSSNPAQVLSNVFTGRNGTAGIIPIIAASMADAHQDAYENFTDITGANATTAADDVLIRAYSPTAQVAALEMVDVLSRAIAKSIEKSPGNSSAVQVRDAFNVTGYSRDNPFALKRASERAIVSSSNSGMLNASRPGTKAELALIHLSVLDAVTTVICRERNGLTLRASHPYWESNTPPLHGNCRSILAPITPPFVESTHLPTTPPASGYGYGALIG